MTVRGQRREIGQTTLSAADVREMPGAFGDPFRAIEALPAVTPIVSGLPYFSIRGAPPNDNGYYLDGVRVPFLFHVGVGEAVIHPALIDRVDFFPAAAPAAYGDAAGAIIAGQTRAPAAKTHGEANLRLFDAGALAETPFGDGRGSVLLAGRYGYPGPILSAITDNVKLGYWDYQARVTWRLDDRDTLGVFAFGSHDFLGTALVRNGAGRTDRRAARLGLPSDRPALRPRAGRRYAADRRHARSRRAGRSGPQRERDALDHLRPLGGDPDRARRQAVTVAPRPGRRCRGTTTGTASTSHSPTPRRRRSSTPPIRRRPTSARPPTPISSGG